MASPFHSRPVFLALSYVLLILCPHNRVFLAEARLILAKMVWNFDFELVDPNDSNWMDQKAYLVFEPKALWVTLREKNLG